MHRARGPYGGLRRQPVQHPADEPDPVACLRVGPGGYPELEGEPILDPVAPVARGERHHVLHHQPGRSQEYERDGQLGTDQRVQPPTTAAPPAAARSRQHATGIDAGRPERRDHPEHRGRAHAHHERERRDPPVETEIGEEGAQARVGLHAQARHQLVQPAGQDQPDRAARDAQHQALQQQLPGLATGRGAHGRTHRQLTLPPRAPDQQQVRDIEARQQEQHAGAHEQRPRETGVVADHVVAYWDGQQPEARVRLGVGLGQDGRQVVEPGLRRLQRPPIAEASHHVRAECHVIAVERVRDPQLRAVRVVVRPRHHSDHRVDAPVQRDGLPEDVFPAAEPGLPERVTQEHGPGLRAQLLLRLRERPTQHRADTQHLRPIRRHPDPDHPLRLARRRQDHRPVPLRHDPVEHAVPLR